MKITPEQARWELRRRAMIRQQAEIGRTVLKLAIEGAEHLLSKPDTDPSEREQLEAILPGARDSLKWFNNLELY